MNARQKAKRFKRLYEELSKQPLPVIFKEPPHIDTLRIERTYPGELITNTRFMQEDISAIATPNATGYVLKDIAFGLAEGLGKYIVYRTDYDPEMNVYRVCGEIKVVR